MTDSTPSQPGLILTLFNWAFSGVRWQFFKYALCGIAAMFTDMLVFTIVAATFLHCLTPSDPLVRLFHLTVETMPDEIRAMRYVQAKAISFVFANLAAYILNILFVFRSGRHRRLTEIALFYLGSGISICAGVSLGWFLIKAFGMPTSFSYITNAVTTISLNFVTRKFFIFRRHPEE